MITNAGRVLIMKNMAKGGAPLSAIAIGDQGVDPVLLVPIAPSPNQVSLKHQVFFEENIQSMEVVVPPTGDVPRLVTRHSFVSNLVPPFGTKVSVINEVGGFAKDPDTGLYVLVWIKTFNNKPFRVPASGSAESRDIVTIYEELF